MRNLLYSHFGISDLKTISMTRGKNLVIFALEKRDEQKLWEYWLAKFPYHSEDEKTFEDLKKKIQKLQNAVGHTMTADEIEVDIYEAMKRF